MSSADGPERGRKTEDLQSKSVLSLSRREAARREQARRDTTKRPSRREQRGWTAAADKNREPETKGRERPAGAERENDYDDF